MGYGSAQAGANTELSSKFFLEIDNIALTAFDKINIGDLEWGAIENRTGIDDMQKQVDSGLKKTQDVDCTKKHRVGGTSDINDVINWCNNGSKDRRSGSIVYVDRDDTEIMRLNFSDAWVKKVQYPENDAESEDGALEWVFTLSVHNLKVA